MALSERGPAPYAPTKNVALVMDQYRERGLTFPLTTGTLNRLGIEESLSRRTLASLKQLDLINEAGNATETLDKIKVAGAADLQGVLADWVRSAYKPIFQYADLSDVQKVTDQFRHYEPSGMRGRMVSLFFGLCAKAGLVEKAPAVPRGVGGKASSGGFAKPPKPAATKLKPPADDPTPPPADPPATAARDRYVDFLLEKAAASDEVDADLLDRIERALGIGGVTS